MSLFANLANVAAESDLAAVRTAVASVPRDSAPAPVPAADMPRQSTAAAAAVRRYAERVTTEPLAADEYTAETGMSDLLAGLRLLADALGVSWATLVDDADDMYRDAVDELRAVAELP